MADRSIAPDRPPSGPQMRNTYPAMTDWRERSIHPDLASDRMAKDCLRLYLVNKFRRLITDRLTPEALGELQYYHRLQFDGKHGWNREYAIKFIMKLREYVHDDVMKREIAGIEALITLMKPEDLRQTMAEALERKKEPVLFACHGQAGCRERNAR